MKPLSDGQRQDLFAILVRYFDALQDGSAERMRCQALYQWRYFFGEMTMERLRRAWEGIDTYLGWQLNWVNQQRERHNLPFAEAGPEMNRLPDDALVAMMQEIDGFLADAGLSQKDDLASPPPTQGTPDSGTFFEV